MQDLIRADCQPKGDSGSESGMTRWQRTYRETHYAQSVEPSLLTAPRPETPYPSRMSFPLRFFVSSIPRLPDSPPALVPPGMTEKVVSIGRAISHRFVVSSIRRHPPTEWHLAPSQHSHQSSQSAPDPPSLRLTDSPPHQFPSTIYSKTISLSDRQYIRI